MTASEPRPFRIVLVRSLASLRLATALLVLLTLAAIAGGVIPQAPIVPNAEAIYRSYGTFWYRIITRLALDDVFHSGWFLGLTGLFALNLSLCSVRRARRSIRRVLRQPGYAPISAAGDEAVRVLLLRDGALPEEVVRRTLRRLGMHRVVPIEPPSEHARDVQLVARRWRWGHLAADLVHLGILVILFGAVLGAFRQEGALIVREGEPSRTFPACRDHASDGGSGACLPIAYDLRVDGFGVETYEGSAHVKTFWADLSFFEGEKVVRRGRISVNHPLSIDGLGFYPWRYGEDTGRAKVSLHVVDRSRDAVVSEVDLVVGEAATLPGSGLTVSAVRFFRTFALTDDGQPVDLGNVPGGYSAVLLEIAGTDATGDPLVYRDLALPFLPDVAIEVPYAFLLAEASLPAFLEIHFARNPGYPIVWWGFVLLMIGLVGAFYFKPSTVRVSITPDVVLLRAEGRHGPSKRFNDIVAALRVDLERQATDDQEV